MCLSLAPNWKHWGSVAQGNAGVGYSCFQEYIRFSRILQSGSQETSDMKSIRWKYLHHAYWQMI